MTTKAWLSIDWDWFTSCACYRDDVSDSVEHHDVSNWFAFEVDALSSHSSIKSPDTKPSELWDKLRMLFNISPDVQIVVRESHKHAAPFFLKDKSDVNFLVNIDSHPDMQFCDALKWLDCGNWVSYIKHKRPNIDCWTSFPHLKNDCLDQLFVEGIDALSILDRPAIDRIFIAKSSPWSSPRYDLAFEAFLAQIGKPCHFRLRSRLLSRGEAVDFYHWCRNKTSSNVSDRALRALAVEYHRGALL